VLNNGSSSIGGVAQVAGNLDRPESSVQAVLHMAQVQGRAEIWWRFGGGSDRNRALLGTSGNSMHDMQIAQSLINTGDCASR
jgi:hypothetical protein